LAQKCKVLSVHMYVLREEQSRYIHEFEIALVETVWNAFFKIIILNYSITSCQLAVGSQ
jgi:hypothetical protein